MSLKCLKCNNPATRVYRPDLDLTGIGMCDEHKEEISVDLLTAQFIPDGWKWFEKKYFKEEKNDKQRL